MPHVTFIYPSIGRFEDTRYVRSWQMQPLSIALLAGLTPAHWDKTFFDDRLEAIDYHIPTDLVAISVETYTAKRAYQIARTFRDKGIPIVMGGYHPTLCPQEVQHYTDALCIGQAEGVWEQILSDRENQSLQKTYQSPENTPISSRFDRTIFQGKNYLSLGLVEAGRGCPFRCNFCSITAFYQAKYQRKNISDLVNEIKQFPHKLIFFVDDNLVADFESAKALFRAIIPLKIRWISQVSINIAADRELMDLMVESGCIGVLIGFESLCAHHMKTMNKQVNIACDYPAVLSDIQTAGIRVYGTFMFGNEFDSQDLMDQTYSFAVQHKLFLAAFNHIVPFPGTSLYETLKTQGSLTYDSWWLSDEYRFGQIPYHPNCDMDSLQVENGCMELRKKFYSLASILKRSLDIKCNCKDLKSFATYWIVNLLMRKELHQKFGLPLGVRQKIDGNGHV